MSENMIRVTWPGGAAPSLLQQPNTSNATLAERLARAGHPLNTRCGQRGLCAGCTVHLASGSFRQRDGCEVAAPADVKSCQGDVAPGASAEIVVNARALAAHRPQVVTTFKVNVPAAHAPIVPVIPGVSDYGLAIDIGTTTVVVALVELTSGRIVAEESAFNAQIDFGDNVLTRIQHAGTAVGLEELRQAIVERTLKLLVSAVCTRGKIGIDRLAVAAVAGNTTMLHLLTGTDPTSLGVAPFRAAFLKHFVGTAGEMRLGFLPAGVPVHLLPGFSAYVGADIVAGCVCTGLLNDPGPSLLIDIGTNGEILLHHDDRLLATATAAGPAFEGGRLSWGTRAVAGAIAHATFHAGRFPPEIDVIPGGSTIVGICGSAYVDFLAETRRLGLLAPHGRFEGEAWDGVAAAHREQNGFVRGIRLVAGDSASVVTEADIAHLLQAKAAIAAGILALLRRAGLKAADVRRLYLAGGFGLHLNVSHAIACGLLPGFRPDQIEIVGNTALGGAWLALIDETVLPDMRTAASAAEIVELNLEPGFEDTFIDELSLP